MVRDQLAESIDAAAELKNSGKTIHAGNAKPPETLAKKSAETAQAVAATVAVSVAMTMLI
jgi:hypothetical protein